MFSNKKTRIPQNFDLIDYSIPFNPNQKKLLLDYKLKQSSELINGFAIIFNVDRISDEQTINSIFGNLDKNKDNYKLFCYFVDNSFIEIKIKLIQEKAKELNLVVSFLNEKKFFFIYFQI
ncbi:MAG: hypothetical protein N2258_08540 [Brevinematales bacterium]|nr:hypothetical protein [Brevinematales bacterium]